MTENYMYYDPTSDCNTCITQDKYNSLSKEDKQKYKRMDGSITNPEDCESIMAYSFKQTQEIYKENQRLKAQLDREIKINRKMKRALEQIASENDCYLTIADKVLKEIDNKE